MGRAAFEVMAFKDSAGEGMSVYWSFNQSRDRKARRRSVPDALGLHEPLKNPAFPIESALVGRDGRGWRAAQPGIQMIRLIFDEPQRLRRICLVFEETGASRTQKSSLRWSPDPGKSFREIVRLQWNFSSPDAAREIEDYAVELSNVTQLDLTIEPDKEERQGSCFTLEFAPSLADRRSKIVSEVNWRHPKRSLRD